MIKSDHKPCFQGYIQYIEHNEDPTKLTIKMSDNSGCQRLNFKPDDWVGLDEIMGVFLLKSQRIWLFRIS